MVHTIASLTTVVKKIIYSMLHTAVEFVFDTDKNYLSSAVLLTVINPKSQTVT